MDLMKKNGSKYLVFDSIDKNKEVLRKYKELWDEIRKINGGEKSEYAKDFMKIMFELDDNLPLKKLLKFPTMTITVRCVFEEMVNLLCR